MRIALDATSLIGHRSGVGRFTESVLDGLAEDSRVDPVAYCLTWRGRDQLAQLPDSVEVAGRRLPARLARGWWGRSDRPGIEVVTGPVDLVHGTNFVVPPSKGVELATVHDLTPLRFPELCTPDTLEYPDLIRSALRRGAHLHVPTEAVRSEVISLLGAQADRVHAIAHGMDPIAPDTAMGVDWATGGRPYFLFIGTLEPRKGLPDLVGAFDETSDVLGDHLLLLAGADGWGVDQLDEAIAGCRRPERIRRLGPVGDPARATLLRRADALVYPSLYEGFGLPPIEAMSVGTPVITSDDPALVETTGGAAALVEIGNRSQLAATMIQLVDDDTLRRTLVARGLEIASGRSWSDATRELIDLYAALVDQHRADRTGR